MEQKKLDAFEAENSALKVKLEVGEEEGVVESIETVGAVLSMVQE